MKKRDRYRWCAAFVMSFAVLVVYLFFSTVIFEKLIETEGSFKRISEETFFELQGDDYVFIEWSQQPCVLSDFYQSLQLKGTVFCENETYSAEKEYGIVLKSQDAIYLAKADPQNGKTAMSNKVAQGYTLASDNILLNVKIPTITLKNEKYDLYIWDYESPNISGLCYTGISFQKTDNGFAQFWGSECRNITSKTEAADVILSIDTLELIDQQTLSITGWATYDAIAPINQTVFVEIYNDPFAEPIATYQSTMLRRSGLGDYLGASVYDYCGFQLHAEMPSELCEIFYIRLVIADEDAYYRSNLRIAYQRNEETFDLVQWRNTTNDEPGDTSTLPVLEMASTMVETDNLYSEELSGFYYSYLDDQVDEKIDQLAATLFIDDLVIDGTMFTVRGHVDFAFEEYDDSRVILHILCKDRNRRAYQVSLEHKEEISEGIVPFEINIPAEYVPDKIEWSIFIDNGMVYHVQDYVAIYSEEGKPILCNSLAQMTEKPHIDGSMQFAIDMLSVDSGLLNVVGWVYSPVTDAMSQQVYLAFYQDLRREPSLIIETTQQIRPGLADNLGLKTSFDYSGYVVNLYTDEIDNTGVWYIRFILVNDGEFSISGRAVKIEHGTVTEYVMVQE